MAGGGSGEESGLTLKAIRTRENTQDNVAVDHLMTNVHCAESHDISSACSLGKISHPMFCPLSVRSGLRYTSRRVP